MNCGLQLSAMPTVGSPEPKTNNEQRITKSVLLCGLAGGLVPSLRPGTVLVPDLVGSEDGTVTRCDPRLREALVRGARALGFNPEQGPLLTAASLVTGKERDRWASRGFVAADMEAALLARRGVRFATVRVVLDAPGRPISEHWLRPAEAMRNPALWSELFWLGQAAPHYTLRAARVLKAGLAQLSEPA